MYKLQNDRLRVLVETLRQHSELFCQLYENRSTSGCHISAHSEISNVKDTALNHTSGIFSGTSVVWLQSETNLPSYAAMGGICRWRYSQKIRKLLCAKCEHVGHLD